MDKVQVEYQVNNLEIISKLMNSVARRCDCRVRYNSEENRIHFDGDPACQKYIVEETLAFFQAA